MTGRGGYWPRRRRRGPGDDYPDEDGYEGSDGYDEPAGYGPGHDRRGSEPYGRGDQYDRSGYGEPSGYDDPLRYGGPAGYGQPGGYGEPGGYGQPGDHGQPGGYGQPGEYRQPGQYGPSGEYRDPGNYPGPDGYADPGQYTGPGGFTEPGGITQPGDYTEPGGHLEPGGFDDRWYGEGRYGGGVGGSNFGSGAYGRAGGYGHSDPYQQYGDTGSFDPRDDGLGGGGAGSQAGWAFQPDTGPYDQDVPDDAGSGSFDRPDTGPFGPANPATFGESTGYDGASSPGSSSRDSGGGRWTAGLPRETRADLGREDGALAEPYAAGSDRYAAWRDEPAAEDWQEDPNSGLLSRRFGQGDEDPPGPRAGRSRRQVRVRKRRRGRGRAAVTVAIVIVLVIVGAAGLVGYKFIHRFIVDRYGNYAGQGFGTVRVTVTNGQNLVGLGPTLLKDRVILALRPYDTAAAAAQGTLQPGVYRLHHHMNARIAVQYLLGSKARLTNKITIIEGTRAAEIAALLAKRTGYPVSQFTQLIAHPAKLGLPSWAPKGVPAEGFLFPDTYTLSPHETPLQILRAMVTDFNNRIAPLKLPTAAATVNTTAWHVLIVASMAQAESGPGDFGKVARVAWNRLTMGIALHFDSTVFYGLHIAGNPAAAATAAEIAKPTPYNTYLNKGLPPGPIGNPGLVAIQAALHPPHGRWLYFITDLKSKPPKTYFTSSYPQFAAWQRKFQG